MWRLFLLGLLMLAGCSTPADPVVDMQGVDQVQYSRDVAWCRNHVEPTWGSWMDKCLKQKGYKVLTVD